MTTQRTAEIGAFPVTNPCDLMILEKKQEENSFSFSLWNETLLEQNNFNERIFSLAIVF